jgi:transcriptional regulator with XRE-family HTH domain
MSYFSIALQRCAERRQLNQSDLAKRSGISNSYISRLYSGESRDLSDANFASLLNAFATDPAAQAEIIAARCQDILAVARAARTPGSELVDILVKKSNQPSATLAGPPRTNPQLPEVELSHETERAFAWLRRQCPLKPDLEKHLVGYAKLTGMK